MLVEGATIWDNVSLKYPEKYEDPKWRIRGHGIARGHTRVNGSKCGWLKMNDNWSVVTKDALSKI